MERNSTVIEIYPDRYHPQIFRAMAKSTTGVINLPLLDNNTVATRKPPKTPRDVDPRPNVTQVIELIRKTAVEHTTTTVQQQRQ
jgi:hypothetical protein